MFITKVRLKNGYKRFHDLTIDLGETPARIVALVGPNGCGKSSVLDGLLYHASAHQVVGQNQNRETSYHSMTGVDTLTWQDIEIQFTAGNFVEVRNAKSVIGKDDYNDTVFLIDEPELHINIHTRKPACRN